MNRLQTSGLLILTLIALGACGNRGSLEPAKGKSLPPAVYGEPVAPSGDKLIEPSSQARPERSDELLRRSEKRQDDKFDLPPTG